MADLGNMRAGALVLWVALVALSGLAHADTPVAMIEVEHGDRPASGQLGQAAAPKEIISSADLPRTLLEDGTAALVGTPLWGKKAASLRRRRRRRRTEEEYGDLYARVQQVDKAKGKEVAEKVGQCQVTPWFRWSSCSTTGKGAGTKFRTRQVIAHPKKGFECPPLKIQAFCAVDCAVSAWMPKPGATCSKSCGGGVRLMQRKVLTPAFNGGTPCPSLTTEEPCNVHPCPVDCQVSNWFDFGYCTSPGEECDLGVQLQRREATIPAAFGGKACPKLAREVSCVPGSCVHDLRTRYENMKPNATGSAMYQEFKELEARLKLAQQFADTGYWTWKQTLQSEIEVLVPTSDTKAKTVAGGRKLTVQPTSTDQCAAQFKTFKDCKLNMGLDRVCHKEFTSWTSCAKACKEFNCGLLKPYVQALEASFFKPVGFTTATLNRVNFMGFVASSPRFAPEITETDLEVSTHPATPKLPPEEFKEKMLRAPRKVATLDAVDLSHPNGAVSRVAEFPEIKSIAAVPVTDSETGVFVTHPVTYSVQKCKTLNVMGVHGIPKVCRSDQHSSSFALGYVSNIRTYAHITEHRKSCNMLTQQWNDGFCHRKLMRRTKGRVACTKSQGDCYAQAYFQNCVHRQDKAICECIQILQKKNEACQLAKAAPKQCLVHSHEELSGHPVTAASSVVAAAQVNHKRYAFITRESDTQVHRVDLDEQCGLTQKVCKSMELKANQVPPVDCYDLGKPDWTLAVTSKRKVPLTCGGAVSDQEKCSFCYQQRRSKRAEHNYGCASKNDPACECERTYVTTSALWSGPEQVSALAAIALGNKKLSLFAATYGPSGATLWHLDGALSPTALHCQSADACSSVKATAIIPAQRILAITVIAAAPLTQGASVLHVSDEPRARIFKMPFNESYAQKLSQVAKSPHRHPCTDQNDNCHEWVWEAPQFETPKENKCNKEKLYMNTHCCASCQTVRQWHLEEWQKTHCSVGVWSDYTACKDGKQTRNREVVSMVNGTVMQPEGVFACPDVAESRDCVAAQFKVEALGQVGTAGLAPGKNEKGLYVLNGMQHRLQSVDFAPILDCDVLMKGTQVRETFQEWDVPANNPQAGDLKTLLIDDDSVPWLFKPFKKKTVLNGVGDVFKEVLCMSQILTVSSPQGPASRLGPERCCVHKYNSKAVTNEDQRNEVEEILRSL